MKLCALVPKSEEGATWYCRCSEIFKKYATAYSADGFETRVRMDNYYIFDATHNKTVAAMMQGKKH